MPSTLGFAILAVLARGARTGYELTAVMGRPVGYFWTARHSQIHTDLQKLLADGLVRFEAEHGPGPQDKKVYHLTPEGMAALRAWVTEPPRARPERDELVLKTYASWLADPAEVAGLFRAQLALHEERIAQYESQQADFAETPSLGEPSFGNYAALWCGLSYERHRADWCRWMLARLDATPRADGLRAEGSSEDPRRDTGH
ncbi:PadR family transcriptional regulator [Sphaerisporangium melleum]|uniref:PadR family transcriptional regulator n=1 Tax=Sphaerisporangium melleum TaxID=321316 RepID=A0A917VEW7_9ACTN|nr:PadR family transcriptional regulator [Sphaerisporangium melleum]GGK72450.1 PadR family transcriptional regulator [Sphaerisporangium melleum]GII68340.1 PadR family transcriptional regulator [Sphaerisporangium melleum]